MTDRSTAITLLLPASTLLLAIGAVPLAYVFFFSVNDTFAAGSYLFVGSRWYQEVLSSPIFQWALLRSLLFSALVLAIQLPLGLWVAYKMSREGKLAAAGVIIASLPLLMPTIVVGYLWKAMALPGAGPLFLIVSALGFEPHLNSKIYIWFVILVMDCWHWIGLVVLLAYAGLKSVPQDYYRAAKIDGASAWAIFRYVEWPRLRMVLSIAALLRFMDSFMVFTETYVIAHGGPGLATEFLANELVQTSTIEFDLGQGGAMAVIYFLIVVAVSIFYFRAVMQRKEAVK